MKYLLSVLTLLLLLPAMAQETPSPSPQLHQIFDDYWDHLLRENPLMATSHGDLRYNDQLGEVGLDARRKSNEADRDFLSRLQKIERAHLSADDQLNYDLLEGQLKWQMEEYQFGSYLEAVHQRSGFHLFLPRFHERIPLRTQKHYHDYLSRLKAIPAVIAETRELLLEGIRTGRTPARPVVEAVPQQIAALLVKPIEDFPLYQPFVNFPSTFSEEAQNDLRQRGTSVLRNEVLPAFETFAKFYKEEYFPKAKPEIGATQRYEDGEKFYAFRIRRFTTTNLTAKEIHEIGLREVTRIKGRMAEIIKATNFAGEFDAFVEFLRTDPQFYYSKPGDLLTGYRDICKRMDAELPLLFGKLPRAPYGVREIPAHEAPRATTAYYNQPSADGSRPGWFFANTYDLKSRPKYEMEALTLHEAVPGHHLQIALQMELENVPKFRTVASYTAFVEGWGLYAESLGKEAGFYTDPYFEFGFLSYEMWRALRLVVDTGMHAFGWSRERAIEFMLANSALTRTNVENEVDRYIAWPGQALAYKIGQLKIRELRTEAETALGEAFDVRTFHDQVLSAGAVPLDILEARFDEWLSQLK
jgi:prolyl oligopeptidase